MLDIRYRNSMGLVFEKLASRPGELKSEIVSIRVPTQASFSHAQPQGTYVRSVCIPIYVRPKVKYKEGRATPGSRTKLARQVYEPPPTKRMTWDLVSSQPRPNTSVTGWEGKRGELGNDVTELTFWLTTLNLSLLWNQL